MKTALSLFATFVLAFQLPAQVTFAPATNYLPGGTPTAVVTADMNGDGKVDLICNSANNIVSVLTNDGSGGFVVAGTYAQPPTRSITAADINGDGKPDLICADFYLGTITVSTNDGIGGLVVAGNYAVGNTPYSVAAADVNGDGKVDLVDVNFNDNTLSVLTNTGTGNFVTAGTYAVGVQPSMVTTADVNGDGKADLISANWGGGTLSVLTNDGSGGFVTASTYGVGAGPIWVAAADVNGDGKVDLISADFYSNTMTVLTNNGNGGFLTASHYAVGSGPFSIAAADVNGDGKVDLICANSGDGTLSVLTNDGSGGFAAAGTLAVGSGPEWLAAADLNGDGKVDLVSANINGSGLSVLLNKTAVLPVGTVPTTNGMLVDIDFGAGPLNGGVSAKTGFAAIGQNTNDFWNYYTRDDGAGGFRTSGSLANLQAAGGVGTAVGMSVSDAPGAWGDASGDPMYGTYIYPLDGGNNVVTFTNLPAGQYDVLVYSPDGNSEVTVGGTSYGVKTSYDYAPTSVPVWTEGLQYARWRNVSVGAGQPLMLALHPNTQGKEFLAGLQILGGGPTPPVITQQPQSQTNIVGGSASFDVTVSGTAPLSYQWNLNGTNIVGATNATLTLNPLQLTQAGNYSVLVSNLVGSTNSAVAILAFSLLGCTPPPAGIVAWWPAEGNVNDNAGANNGTLLNGASFAAGEVGQAFLFGTPDAGVKIPANPTLDVGLGGGFTLEGWINPSTLASRGYIAEWNNGDTNLVVPYGVQLEILSPGELGLGAGNLFSDVHGVDGNVHWIMAPGGTITANTFQHVAVTYDKGSGVATLYCNGAIVAQQYLGSFTPLTSSDFYIGRRPAGVGSVGSFSGSIDEFSVYNRALSSAEIQSIYNSGNAGKCYTPVAPVITTQPQDQTNLVGGSASFTVMASGTAPLSYQWNFNGTNIAGATNATLTLNNLPLTLAGNYEVVVADPLGSVTSSPAMLDVQIGFAQVSFAPATNYPVGGISTAVVTADMNGDGKVDLICDAPNDTVTVLTNDGSGGFMVAGTYAQPGGTRSITATDINGDGKPDLICATGPNVLQVFTNDGTGGLVVAGNYAVGNTPYSVAAADVNGDGRVDLVAANFNDNTLSVLTNTGTGNFVTTGTYAVGVQPSMVTTADVNGDGKPDLISANWGAGTLSVLTNNGSGGFVTAGRYTVGAGPVWVAAADVNGDGKVDLISADYYSNTMTVLTNNGSGGFVTAAQYVVGSAPFSIAAADVNGDGKVDLVCANSGESTLSVLTNDGSGGFVAAGTLAVGSGPEWVTAADLNGDGRVDLVSANYNGPALSVLLNTTIFPAFPIITQQPLGVTVAPGGTVNLTVTATGADLSYQWQAGPAGGPYTNLVNGGQISGANSNVLTIASVTTNWALAYRVIVTNSFGSITSSPPAMLDVRFIFVSVNGQLVTSNVSVLTSSVVTITGGYPGGFLFYTLDGSLPTASSPFYTGPITLTSSAVVQVMSLSLDFSEAAYASPVVVTFIPDYNVQTSVLGSGTISLNPTNGPFFSNSVVTVTATASAYWAFDHWTGDVSGSQNPLTVIVDGPLNIQADFVQAAYPLTVGTLGGGTVSVNGQAIVPATYYTNGSVVTLAATAGSGWTFLGWQGSTNSLSNPLSVTITQTNNLQAIFGTVVATNAVGGGRIVLNQTNPVPYGTILTASAVPAAGNFFVIWSGAAGGTNAPVTVVVTNGNPTINALFSTLPNGKYSLSVAVNGNGSVAVSPQRNYYNLGDSVTLSASATNVGGTFYGWTGDVSSTNNSITVVMTTNKVVSANFIDFIKPTLTITAPTPGLFWSNLLFTVKGTAGDNVAVANVFYQLNTNGWNQPTPVNNWSNWQATVSVLPGTNVLQAYAVDTTGNLSTTSSVSFVCFLSDVLRVQTVGRGTISPNYSNALLQVGANYSMTAAVVAGSGFAFTNWTGGTTLPLTVLTNGQVLQFQMVSNLTLQANFVDTNRPTLAITNVISGLQVSNVNFVVKGWATDNVAVAGVYCQLNTAGWSNATSFNGTNWAAAVALVAGTNTISAYAVDSSGNNSATNSVKLVYVVNAPLTVELTGRGTISPNYSNAVLQVGVNYSLTAAVVAGSGFAFTNWTGGTNLPLTVLTNGQVLQFQMVSNLVLQANFVDTNRPTLTITVPTQGQHMTNALAAVAGTAGDNWQVAGVWYQLNGGAWNQPATTNHWTNWTTTVELQKDTNTIKAYAMDTSGNISLTNSVSIVSSNAFLLKLAFTTVPPLATNGLNFALQISTGLNGHIEVSTNLLNWLTLTNFIGTTPTMNFRDAAATNFNRRYYRAVVP